MVGNRLRFSIKGLKTDGYVRFWECCLRSGIFWELLIASIKFSSPHICGATLDCPHREGIHTSGKIRFFEKWSRDTPKMPILAVFGPFLEVFADFLKNGSNDFFLTSCNKNSSLEPGDKLCLIQKILSYIWTVGAYIWQNRLFQPDFRYFGPFLQSKIVFRPINHQIGENK